MRVKDNLEGIWEKCNSGFLMLDGIFNIIKTILGIKILPMLIIADARIDMKGNVRLQFSRQDIAFTSRLRFGFMVNTDREYMFGLRYIVTKTFSISTQYDSDLKFGAGITLNY